MAVVLRLPVVFAIENNGFGEHTGNEYASGGDLTRRTEGFGMPCVKVDGTDFFAVYEAMQEAIERAHKGKAPLPLKLWPSDGTDTLRVIHRPTGTKKQLRSCARRLTP